MIKNNEKGFTLIELVIVIVVLGILAAFAFSRYIAVTRDARIAAVNGLAGGLNSAVALVQGRYLINGNIAAITVTMLDGTVVSVNAGVAGGIPTGAIGGIGAAMRDTSGFNVVYGAPTTYQPTNGGSATCQASYAPATGIVTVSTGDC